jgi:hypothetical protein
MPIKRLLDSGSFEADEIEVLNEAYEKALRALYLVDRNDPLTEIVAKKVIEISRTGLRDPAEISSMTVAALGLT